MAESLLISDDGYLLTHADGSIITDKDGAPCCCGGEVGCCICADLSAKKGDPCFVDYAPVPPDKLCNSNAKCCCGSKIRVTIAHSGTYHEKEGKTSEDITITETFVYEFKIEKGNGGKCIGVVTPISYNYLATRHFVDWQGNSHDDEITDDDPAHGFLAYSTTAQDFAAQCRPEPVHLANHGVLWGNHVPDDWRKKFNPFVYATWAAAFLDHGCGGSKPFKGPNGETANDSWSSSAKCKGATLSAHAASDYGYFVSDSNQTVTLSIVTIEDNCCPKDDGGVTPNFDWPTGISPAADGGAAQGGGYSFCRCGSLVSGEFCGACRVKRCAGCGD